MIRQRLQETIETARREPAFQNYLRVRERVLDMLDEAQKSQTASPSDYWEEELAGFDYMLDASPLVIRKLREHCYHLTGLRSNEYRKHHSHRRQMFVEKLHALEQQDADNLFVPESEELGGFGFEVDGRVVNLDTLKYYECLIALDKAGLLDSFRAGERERKVVVEIGGGWGALGYQFKRLYPNTCYIIVDLPQTLIFSAVYLQTLFPESSTFIYGDGDIKSLATASYDFVFLPHYFFPQAELERVDLAINTVSFQEMTTEQVEGYARKLSELRCAHLYSLNRDRSPHNKQLTTVSDILKKYYALDEVSVLDIPYTMLSAPDGGGMKGRAKNLARKLLSAQRDLRVYEYRHLAGSLNSSVAQKAGAV